MVGWGIGTMSNKNHGAGDTALGSDEVRGSKDPEPKGNGRPIAAARTNGDTRGPKG
jgi:hypothetical protein